MKVARFHPVRPVMTISELFGTTGSGPSGQVLTATGSNSSSVAWGSNVATITSNGSNVLVGPYVGLQSGTGIAFSASSNILTISSTVTGGGGSGSSTVFAGAKAYATATQSVTDSTETAIVFDSEEYDTDGYHSTVTNTARFTVPTGKAGYYNLQAGGNVANTAGNPELRLRLNGTTYIRGGAMGPTGLGAFVLNISAEILLADGDYVELIGYQTSGATQTWGHATLREQQFAMSVTAQTTSSGGGASVSYGSNATRVSEVSSAGVATTVSSSDHIHDGIGTITASSSNTMQRGTFNLRPGSGIALNLTDTDGDGEFDTATIVNTGSGGGGGAAASGALTFISETVLGSAAAEINITGLPTTYKDLIVVAKFRSATASTKAIAMRFGDSSAIDTGSNYSFNRRYDGTLANGASQNTSATYMECGALPGSGSTAGFFGAGRWEIIDYASTSRSRIMIGETFDDANDGNFMNSVGGMWKNVTAAVARIRLIVTDGSNFDTNSSITVYGRG